MTVQHQNTAGEIKAPSVIADFEAGDKLAFRYTTPRATDFASVLSVEEDHMMVEIFTIGPEARKITGTDVAAVDDINHVSQWRKMPNEWELSPGDVLSTTSSRYVSTAGKRQFFTIIDIVPGRMVTLQNNENSDHVVTSSGFGDMDLVFQHWELED